MITTQTVSRIANAYTPRRAESTNRRSPRVPMSAAMAEEIATAKARIKQAAPSVITAGASIRDDHVLGVLLCLRRVLRRALRDQAVPLGHEGSVRHRSRDDHLAPGLERVGDLPVVADGDRL